MAFKRAFRAFFLLLLPLLASCGYFSKPEPLREYVTIGALFPLSGEFCHEGLRALNGLQLARQEINEAGGVLGKKLDIIVIDDQGDPQTVAEKYEDLKRRGVVAVIGSSFSNVTLELARAAQRDGMPVISPTASNPAVTEGRGNVFRLTFLDDHMARALASFAVKGLSAKTALILAEDSRYSEVAEAFEKEFRALGGAPFPIQRYSKGEGFDAILAKYAKNRPDIIFCPTDYIVASQLAASVRRAGLDETKLLGTDAWDGILVFLRETSMMDRIYYATPFAFDDEKPEIVRFSRAFFDEFSHMPLGAAGLSYTTVQILVGAIENAGGTDSADIIKAMRTVGANTLLGHIRYDSLNSPHISHGGVYIMRIENKHYSTVEKIVLPEGAQ